MDFIQALILSVVEGVTEFLPISSTGHLVLTSHLLQIPQTDFVKSFEIFIQLGAILAVVWLYKEKLLEGPKVWKNVFLAFIPTAVLGLVFYKFIKDVLLGNIWVTIIALFLGGLVLIFLDKILPEHKKGVKKFEDLTPKKAMIVGLFQSISMIPGVSRAGATIIGGLFLGLSKEEATKFSFLLAIPTMAAATGFDLVKTQFNFSSSELTALLIGFAGSFVTALITINWFVKFVQSHNFVPFGVYRIVLALVFWIILLR